MTEQHKQQSAFIARRQRAREKTHLTRKSLIRLILVSVVLCVAFIIWADVSPESIELAEMAIFALVMLVAIIVAAIGVGLLLSLIRRRNRAKRNDSLSILADRLSLPIWSSHIRLL